MTNKIAKIIKTIDTLHWGRYEPSQDTRHKNIFKNIFNSQNSGPFLPLVTKTVKFPNRPDQWSYQNLQCVALLYTACT